MRRGDWAARSALFGWRVPRLGAGPAPSVRPPPLCRLPQVFDIQSRSGVFRSFLGVPTQLGCGGIECGQSLPGICTGGRMTARGPRISP